MKFGTSGLRGLVTDLQGHASALYATAFGRYLLDAGLAKPGDRVFVAGDYRPSTPDIAATCMGALARTGLVAVDCGAIPTPALACYAMARGAASLMVTGSHIPADRNGIKFYRPDGEIDKTDEQRINQIAAELSDAIRDLTPGGGSDESSAAMESFLARYRTMLGKDGLSGLRIGVYQHSSVARDGLVDILAGFGADVIALGRSETFIPVDTEAVSADTIQLLAGWSAEHRLDAIVSADGDGDRPLVADENGAPLRGDLLGLIAAKFLGASVVVTPVTSNSGIEASGAFEVIRTKVGSPFVIDGMNMATAAGKSAIMGFEANGGVLTASSFQSGATNLGALPTRDSFLPILACLALAKSEARPLSAIASAFNLPFASADRLENFPVDTSAAFMTFLRGGADNLGSFLRPLGEVLSTSDIDGLRVTLSGGRTIHFRPSGNAPEMRCYVEAADETSSAALLSQGLTMIQQWAANRH
ncbi:phosphomannomutase [Rhizobium sp. 0TCS1.26]|uniref:phosphomannomutase n=1 Tax=Rhizobium sp. 0TCS1.26 TaxID=3142623 RepID=UPI003D2AFA3F